MIALLLALSSAVAQQATAPAGTLQQAEITIVLEDSYASVVANYVIERSGDSLVFRAARMLEQIVLVEGAFGPDYALRPVHQVEERLLLAPPGQTGSGLFRIRYKAEGDITRLPLFLPNTATAADAALGITVVNVSEEAISGSPLPFQRLSDSAHFARVDSLPGSVFLPSGGGAPGLQTVVLLAALILTSAAVLYSMSLRITTLPR